MGVLGIIAVISLVFSTIFGISGFVISLINLILGIKKNQSEKKSADENSKTLKQDSERNAEHLEVDKDKLEAIKQLLDFLNKGSLSIALVKPKKEDINTEENDIASE